MPLQLLQGPAVEPVTLAEAKLHLSLDSDLTADDALVSSLIVSARSYAEMRTGRCFITQKWRLVLDAFPGPSLTGTPFGRTFSIPPHAILLPKCTVQSVDSVNYTDMDGSAQVMPATDYKADLASNPARITPRFGKIWPIPLPEIGSVWVDFTSGYGDTSDTVPEGIKDWIKIRINTLYENREEAAILNRGQVHELPWVDSLLDPYTVVTL